MQHQEIAGSPRLFPTLGLITAVMTIGLIVVGATVRVTGSGLGCGDDWPLCNGSIIPPFDDINAWIEWSHRLLAMLIGLFGIGMLVTGFRTQRSNRLALGATVAAAMLYTVQSGLGRSVVKAELSPTLVAIHLGTAMLLLATLLTAAVAASYRPQARYARDYVTKLIYVTTALSFLIILTGALVRGSGANLACVDWPLCNGEVLPFSQGQLATIHMLHRFAVVALGLTVLALAWYVLHERNVRQVRVLAVLVLLSYLGQVGIGAMFVFSAAAPIWGAAHVGVASVTWALLIALSVIETRNTLSGEQVETQWKPEPLSN